MWNAQSEFLPYLHVRTSWIEVYGILDEYILAGEFQETSKKEILERMREIEKLE